MAAGRVDSVARPRRLLEEAVARTLAEVQGAGAAGGEAGEEVVDEASEGESESYSETEEESEEEEGGAVDAAGCAAADREVARRVPEGLAPGVRATWEPWAINHDIMYLTSTPFLMGSTEPFLGERCGPQEQARLHTN